MEPQPGRAQSTRFGPFEVNLRAGELHKHGLKIRLQDQPFQILAMLLAHPGEVVTREELRQKLWPADTTFVDFDHGLNNAINRLREALGDSADHPRYVETAPRRGYRFIAPLDYEREVSAPLRIQSLAVLPLENLTGDPSQEYFVDGMTDALITNLAQISALRVISRTSAMQYKGVRKPLPEIARELNVDAVVEGAVARTGDRVRITAQLVDAPNDRHVWAEEYERELHDILALQSEVARAIAAEIQVRLTPQEQARLARTRPVNPEAYEGFLKGRFHWNKRTREGLKRGLEYFQESVEKDPGYAFAYAGLADCYNMLGFWSVLPPNEASPAAKAAAKKALELDQTLAEAHAALAWPTFTYDWDWPGAERGLRRALELNPGYATAHQWYSHWLVYQGCTAEALAHVQRTLEIDPVSFVMNSSAGIIHFLARRYDEALEHCRKTHELDPNYVPPYLWLGQTYALTGRMEEAFAAFQRGLALSNRSPVMLAGLGNAYAASGQRNEANKLLDELHELSKGRYVAAYDLALVYAGLGDNEETVAWLERAYQDRSAWLVWLKVDPRLDRLHADPRFDELVRRIGLSTPTSPPQP